MLFDVPADAYDRYMGRFSRPLARTFAEWLGLDPPMHALDVGAGTGALTSVLLDRLGAGSVTAIEPSPPFAAALIERFPGLPVVIATAEQLPVQDAQFDLVAAQLVVHFMADPVRGLEQLARAAGQQGRVAACVWQSEGCGPADAFWAAARAVDPEAPDESHRPGVQPGELVSLFEAAGMREVEETVLSVTVRHESFEAWWEPFESGAGPGGAFLVSQPSDVRRQIRAAARVTLGAGPFATTAKAWGVRAWGSATAGAST